MNKKKIKTFAKTSAPWWAWPAYFLLLWEILLTAQNPGLMSDDSGEMAAAAFGLGIPHPPGYPLLNLLGRIASMGGVGTVAFRLNLLASVLVLLSLWLIIETFRKLVNLSNLKLSHGPFVSQTLLMVMGLYFISCRNVFSQCLTAKGSVYALTLVFSAAMLWFRIKKTPLFSSTLLICFLWAMGMANHWQTQILWLPFIFLSFGLGKLRWNLKTVFYFLTVGFLGLSLYLYLPLRAALGVDPCWGNPLHLKGFYWIVSRQLVKGSENWIQDWAFYIHSGEWVLRTMMMYFFPGLTVLALAGVFILWVKKNIYFYDLVFIFLPVLAAVALVHEERNQYLVPVYLVTLTGVLLIFSLVGATWLIAMARNKIQVLFFWGILALGSVGWLSRVYLEEDKSRYTLAEDFGSNVMKALPRDAVLLADGDHYVMSIWYGQQVKKQRPDLVFQPSIFLYHDWGWSQLGKKSEDIRGLIYSTPLFVGRLKALCDQTPQHPLFYSLGRDYLDPLFKQLPGQWVPRGLSFEWKSESPESREVSKRLLWVVKGERLRGLLEIPDFNQIDQSTTQLYRYYASQH